MTGKTFSLLLLATILTTACGGSPTAPTTPASSFVQSPFTAFSGTVTSMSGTPIGGAVIRAENGVAITKPDGTYTLPGLAVEGMTVVASAANYLPVTVTFHLGPSVVNFKLETR